MDELSISLVICTMGREKELRRCINSIIDQGHARLEVVIVDQSGGEQMVPHVEHLRAFCRVHHIRTERIGASAARNLGARHTTGEVISFPDDDCWYTPGVLALVNKRLADDSATDGITGRTVSEDGSPGNGRFANVPAWVSRKNAWTTSIEFTIFVRRRVWESVGCFDETIGTGAKTPFQAGEGTDFIIRAVDQHFRIWFTPELAIGHPQPTINPAIFRKVYYYGVGMGYLARKYRLPARETIALLVRPFLGIGVSLLRGRLQAARFHAFVGAGRSMGYFRGGSFVSPHTQSFSGRGGG